MYYVGMGGKTYKERMTFSIDADIAARARKTFAALDMNMSQFVEFSFVQMLTVLEPFDSFLDDDDVDPTDMKMATRLFVSNASALVGQNLVDFGQLTRSLEEDLRQEKEE